MYLLSVAGSCAPGQVWQGTLCYMKPQGYCPRGAQHGRNPLTIVLNDFGLLLVVILLDTVDLYCYLRINNGVFAFVHLGQLLTRDDLWKKQRKRSGYY